MSPSRVPISQQELHYFGKVSASVSHELKNVLAILNENAGLLQDFAAMAEQGQPLDPDRIRRLAATMLGQIDRGDVIIKRMNRFAHSADEDRATVDLDELVTMVVELFGRTAANRGVTVEVKTAVTTINIKTDPFALETLLGSLLYRITEAVPDIGTLNLELGTQADDNLIRLPGLAEHADMVTRILESNDIKALLATLNGSAGFNQKNGELVITLPGAIET
ncbi:MAG: sensor histidine kinase [Halobacteria archaeon]|nr:sensor histidine kinase [Halobacteria archaeon]